MTEKVLQGWAILPPDILKQVLSQLPAAQCWSARHVSTHWRILAQAAACFRVERSIDNKDLIIKIRELFWWRYDRRLPRLDCAFSLKAPTEIRVLSALLEMLLNEVLSINMLSSSVLQLSHCTCHAGAKDD